MDQTQSSSKSARPFGFFERMVSRRYLGATRSGGGISLISVISFLGIALSVTALIVVMSVFQGFRVTLLNQLLSVNGHAFVVSPEPFTDYETVVKKVRSVPGVVRATPILTVETWAVADKGQGGARIQGIEPADLASIEEVVGEGHLVGGSLEQFGSGRNGGIEIAIAAGLANTLGVWAGDSVTLITAGGAETAMGRVPTTEKTYRVAAVFRIGNSVLDNYFIFMPLQQAQLFGRKKGQVDEIEIRVEEPLTIDPYLGPISDAVGADYYVTDWRQRNIDIFNALEVEQAMMRIILFFLVAVSTLLIITGLIMMVKDKRSDIAVLRTMGTTQGGIMRIFLMVGATIGVSGAVAGVVLGTLIANNLDPIEGFLSGLIGIDLFNPAIYMLDRIPCAFDWGEVKNVVIFTLIMSFIASVFPAWRASRVDPVEALRYE